MNTSFPHHIGFIMDGNGRWAKKRLLPKNLGHKAGAAALDDLVQNLEKTNTKHITVYAFSTENWKRSDQEIQALMAILKNYIKDYIKKSKTTNIKVDTIGDTSVFDKELRDLLAELEKVSSEKTGINLHIALNYGGRDELVRAVKKIGKDIKTGKLSIDEITEETISKNLDTKNIKDPDLVIRTSGEMRTSNFLIWQSAYSELYFCEKLWPDFNFNDLKIAIDNFNKRKRRFGGRDEEN